MDKAHSLYTELGNFQGPLTNRYYPLQNNCAIIW